MTQQHASVLWQGSLKDGAGSISTESGGLSNIPYSFHTRFEGQAGTNPEELIAAAHASCFTMALAAAFTKEKLEVKNIKTTATVTLDKAGDSFEIKSSALKVSAEIPGIDEAKFQQITADAKANCPVSKLLKAEITLEATLEGAAKKESAETKPRPEESPSP